MLLLNRVTNLQIRIPDDDDDEDDDVTQVDYNAVAIDADIAKSSVHEGKQIGQHDEL